MADWVHCNTCYKQPFEIKSQFHLTNCGHIFCEICTKQVPGYCQMCKQKCSTVLLTNKMKPEVEKFFVSPKDTLSQIMKVLDFQDGHRQRLVKYRMSKTSSNQMTSSNNEVSQSELQREMQRLKEENNYLKQALLAMKSQQTDVVMHSRSSTPHHQVMQSPLKKTPGSQTHPNQRLASMTTPNQQHTASAGHTPGTLLSQSRPKTPSDRISIRTPPVGGVIATPSPCKMYKLNSSGGYQRLQQRQTNETMVQRSRIQSSPASGQMRSRSTTPTCSLQRPITPGRYGSPCDIKNFTSSSQRLQQIDATPSSTPSNKTPYTSRPESSSPMQINSSLDPAQRQIRLTYQPRSALISKYPSRASQQQT